MTPIEESLKVLVAAAVREALPAALEEALRPDEYLPTAAAAKLAGIYPGTLRRWLDRKWLTRYNAGREVRISRRELELLLKNGVPRRAGKNLTPQQLAAKKFG
jgi:excisionase family DNA binding protein